MSKKCTPLWREAHFQVKMYKTHHVRTTFGSCDVEKVHAVVARSTFPSENVQNTPWSDHFWQLRCRKSACRCGAKHIKLLKTPGVRTTFGGSDVASLHYITLHYTPLHLVVEVKAFQWNVRPRWGRNFWKSVRCCVQLVFIMFVFSPIDGLSWVFHGYHADGCSYSLVFWESCTSLVARPVVQDSYKHRRILGRCYHKVLQWSAAWSAAAAAVVVVVVACVAASGHLA